MDPIVINSHDLLSSAKHSFALAFPFLKIEFFTKTHDVGKPSWTKFMIQDLDERFESVSPNNSKGVVVIRPHMRVADLEQHFQELFGFGVQVFRKSKNTWLETTSSDDTVLEELNLKAKTDSENISEMIFDGDSEG
ncbi:MAG: hypothetical protein M3Q56_12835 [Bacteroidota bacterium]|nr:hypothetical protein [Bacteroidota bacterium]